MNKHDEEVAARVKSNRDNSSLNTSARAFMQASIRSKYSYNFTWLGRPIIQYPQDMIAMQEILWLVQPDLVVETGIAHGGSLIFSAAMLELNAACGGPKSAEVLGLDIDIRAHNREAIEAHPMAKRISMIEGSSIASDVIEQVKAKAATKHRVLVSLDSNHTHDHVLAELEAYSPLVSVGSYCVVFDTIIEDLPEDTSIERPWGRGNNPKTATREFLRTHPEFEADRLIDNKISVSVASEGYLRRVR